MLIPYDVTAVDLGTALSIAQHRAMVDGYTHVSIQSTAQTGPSTWEIVVFCANSQGVTRRGPGFVPDSYGGHWCPQPALCQH